MRILFIFIFSLFLASCEKSATTENAKNTAGSSVNVEGEYKIESNINGLEKIVFGPNGVHESHRYYSDGKQLPIKTSQYVIEGNLIKITGASIPHHYEILGKGEKLSLAGTIYVKVE